MLFLNLSKGSKLTPFPTFLEPEKNCIVTYIEFWVWNDLASRMGDVSTSSKRRLDFETFFPKNYEKCCNIVRALSDKEEVLGKKIPNKLKFSLSWGYILIFQYTRASNNPIPRFWNRLWSVLEALQRKFSSTLSSFRDCNQLVRNFFIQELDRALTNSK